MASIPAIAVSPEEYLMRERQADRKHEFRDGEIVEMPGSSRAHDLLSTNLIGYLFQQLAKRGYEIHTSDMRVKVSETGLYTYPDASVVIGEGVVDDTDVDVLLNPAVLFEVLSQSTESYDRGEKFRHYSTIESLRDYVLISQDQCQVECFSRTGDGEWTDRMFRGREAVLEVPSIPFSLPLSDLYFNISFADDVDA